MDILLKESEPIQLDEQIQQKAAKPPFVALAGILLSPTFAIVRGSSKPCFLLLFVIDVKLGS